MATATLRAMDAKAATQRMQVMWDGIAPVHSKTVQDRVMAPANDAMLAAIKGHTATYDPPTADVLDVLDIAGGSGYPAIPLAKEMPAARITLTDLSPKMVDIVKDRVEGDHLDDRITAQQADAQDLSKFDAASFDLVTCQYGLSFMPDHAKTLQEAARVLRPGGLLAASVFGEEQQTAQLFQETAKRLQLEIPTSQFQSAKLADVDLLTADFKEAGFAPVTVTPYVHTMVWDRKGCVAFVCAWLKGRLLMAQAESRATIAEEAPQAVQDAMKALGFMSDDGELCTLINQAYMYAGVKPGVE